LARAVWDLGNPLVLTTNYDMVLQWGCPATVAKDLDFWDIEAKMEQAQLLRYGRTARPTIWYLHGRIGNADEVILTPDGYKRLYGGDSESRYKAALRTFQTILASRSFLFVGFSFEDDALDVQLKSMNEFFAGAPGPHYALIREQDLGRFRSLNLPVEAIPFTDFGEPLIALLRQMEEIAKAGHASLPPSLQISTSSRGASYSTDNRPFFVPFRPKGEKVIGAEQVLRRVRDQLTTGRPTSIGQTAAFEGLGGLGKTQLAVEYAYLYGDEYSNGVIWLTADQDISAQLTHLAVDARWVAPESDHKVKLDIAQHRVRSYSDCLIVFDNVEDLATLEPYLPLPSAQPHLLGTSRTEQPGFVPVPLDVLDEDLSLALLISEAGRFPGSGEEETAAREIARELGGLPLALEMAGAYLLYRPVRWQQYRDLLIRNPKEAFRPRLLASFTRHEADLFAALRIQEGFFEAEPLLRDILNVLTWSGSAAMGLSLLAGILGAEDAGLVGALSLGVQLRLLERSAEGDRYGLHRLVRTVRQEDRPLAEDLTWAEDVCRRLGDWFFARRQDFADLATFEAEIDHLQRWREQAMTLHNSQASRLTWLLAYPPFHRGQYADSHRWLEQARALFESEGNLDSEFNAWLWNDLGAITFQEGRYREALELYDRVLAIRRKVLGEAHADTATSLLQSARSYSKIGDLGKALEYSNQALTIQRKVLGEEHRASARAFITLGEVFTKRSDLDRALDYYSKALAISRKTLYDAHPETAVALALIGEIYKARGDWEGALNHYSQALAIERNSLGDEHPETAKTLNSIGAVYYSSGNFAQALEFCRQGFEIDRKALGLNHIETIVSAGNVADALRKLNRRQEAFNFLIPYIQNPPSNPEESARVKSLVQKLKAKPFRPGFRLPPAQGKKKRKKKRRQNS